MRQRGRANGPDPVIHGRSGNFFSLDIGELTLI
jgi:hypothetical protein